MQSFVDHWEPWDLYWHPVGKGKTMAMIKILSKHYISEQWYKDGVVITPNTHKMNLKSAQSLENSRENEDEVILSAKQEYHVQSVLKRQRKFKKSKKQRPTNRHYEFGTKPICNRQQANHYQQQGHNKMQFASRR